MPLRKPRPSPPQVRPRAFPPGPWATRVLGLLALLAFSVFILGLFGRMMAPFLMSLLTAAMLAVLVHPLYRGALRLSGRSPTLSALAVTLFVAGLILGPGAYGISRLVGEAADAAQGIQSWVQANPLGDVGTALRDFPMAEILGHLGLDEAQAREAEARIQGMAQEAAAPLLGAITARFANFASNALIAALQLVLILASLFFFLKEGGPWVRDAVSALPLSTEVKELMLDRFTTTVRAVVHGIFLSAAAQGLLMGLGLWLFGVPLPLLLGITAFFASLVPLVGPIVVWLPASLWLWFPQDRPLAAALLALYGALFVGMIDNFIKPLVIGGRTRMPAFFLFLSILGGIKEFGPIGLFLGPVVLSLVMALAGVYRGLISKTQNPKLSNHGDTEKSKA